MSALGATPAASGAAATVSVPPPSMLKGKSIEEIVNKWTSDLEVHVREFSKYASEVAVWDRALVENGNNVRDINLIIDQRSDDLPSSQHSTAPYSPQNESRMILINH